MRQKITINVDWDAIIQEVDKTCAYIGSKADGEGVIYEKIKITNAKQEMLDRFKDEAVGIAEMLFADYDGVFNDQRRSAGNGGNDQRRSAGNGGDDQRRSAGNGGNGGSFVLDMPGNYDTRRNAVVDSQVFLMMVYYIVCEWLKVCGVEKAEYAEKLASVNLSIVENLRHRIRPKRVALPVDDITEEIEIGYEDVDEDDDENEGVDD